MEKIDPIIKEQLAAQAVAIMDAHFTRPSAEQKLTVLEAAERQVMASKRIAEGQSQP